MPADRFQRVAVIAALTAKVRSSFGRTALMKCLYFLQTVRGVPLGYDFRLYTYGPFDSDVLSDLKAAERLCAIESQLLQFSGGYGYELKKGGSAQTTLTRSSEFLSQHMDAINWVVTEFGNRSALDLETASTVVFIDRSVGERGARVSIKDLARRVQEVKPHLDRRAIEAEAERLHSMGILEAAA